jgi:hypothetical protein
MRIAVIAAYQGREENYQRTLNYMRFIQSLGHTPLSAVAMFHDILDDTNEEHRKAGMAIGDELLGLCDEAWVFINSDTGITEGMACDGHTAHCMLRKKLRGVNVTEMELKTEYRNLGDEEPREVEVGKSMKLKWLNEEYLIANLREAYGRAPRKRRE